MPSISAKGAASSAAKITAPVAAANKALTSSAQSSMAQAGKGNALATSKLGGGIGSNMRKVAGVDPNLTRNVIMAKMAQRAI